MLIPYFISVFIHILGAVVWLGGSILILLLRRKIKIPREIGSADTNNYLSMLSSYRTLMWICLFVLFTTGLYNLFVRGYNWYDLGDTVFWEGYFGETLMVKLMLFFGILVCGALNDVCVGKILDKKSSSENVDANKLYKSFCVLIGISLVLGLGVLFCAIMLVRGRPW